MTQRFKYIVIMLFVMASPALIPACQELWDTIQPEPTNVVLPEVLKLQTATNQIECCTGPGLVAITAIGNGGDKAVEWSLGIANNNLGASVSQTSGELKPGEQVNVYVNITTCPEPGEVGHIELTVSFELVSDPWTRVMSLFAFIDVRRCEPRKTAVIPATGMTGLEGLNVIAPDQSIFGALGERFAVGARQTYGLIDVATSTTEVVSSGAASHFGVVPLQAPSDGQSDVLVAFGAAGVEVLSFIDADGAFSPFAQIDPPNSTAVFDVVPYAGDRNASGVVVARQERVQSLEYSSDTSVDTLQEGPIAISANAFITAGAAGDVVSAFALSSTGPVLAVKEGVPGTSDGQLFFWTADDPDALTLVGSTGDTPRQIRGVKIGESWLLAVSNFGDSSLTLVRREGSAAPTITGSVTLAGRPVGIDAMATSDGAAAFVATGFDTDTFSIVKVATDGSVLGNTSTALDPNEVDDPGHAVWLDDGAIAISGNASNTVLIVPDMLP